MVPEACFDDLSKSLSIEFLGWTRGQRSRTAFHGQLRAGVLGSGRPGLKPIGPLTDRITLDTLLNLCRLQSRAAVSHPGDEGCTMLSQVPGRGRAEHLRWCCCGGLDVTGEEGPHPGHLLPHLRSRSRGWASRCHTLWKKYLGPKGGFHP